MHRRVATNNSSQRDESLHTSSFRPTKRAASSSSTNSGVVYLLIIIVGLIGLLLYQKEATNQEINGLLKEEQTQIGAIQSELELQKSIFEEERKQLKNELKNAEQKQSLSAETGDIDQSEFFRRRYDSLKEEMQNSAKFNAIEK